MKDPAYYANENQVSFNGVNGQAITPANFPVSQIVTAPSPRTANISPQTVIVPVSQAVNISSPQAVNVPLIQTQSTGISQTQGAPAHIRH